MTFFHFFRHFFFFAVYATWLAGSGLGCWLVPGCSVGCCCDVAGVSLSDWPNVGRWPKRAGGSSAVQSFTKSNCSDPTGRSSLQVKLYLWYCIAMSDENNISLIASSSYDWHTALALCRSCLNSSAVELTLMRWGINYVKKITPLKELMHVQNGAGVHCSVKLGLFADQ